MALRGDDLNSRSRHISKKCCTYIKLISELYVRIPLVNSKRWGDGSTVEHSTPDRKVASSNLVRLSFWQFLASSQYCFCLA